MSLRLALAASEILKKHSSSGFKHGKVLHLRSTLTVKTVFTVV